MMSDEETIRDLEKLAEYWRQRVPAPCKHRGGELAERRSRRCSDLAAQMRSELALRAGSGQNDGSPSR